MRKLFKKLADYFGAKAEALRMKSLPPRRLSIESKGRNMPDIVVLLDGHEVKYCTAYDQDGGWVEVLQYDHIKKRFILNRTNDAVIRDRRMGVVTVRWASRFMPRVA